MSYDEQAELTRYLWRYHWSLLSRFEWQVERAAHAGEKYTGDPSELARRMMERYGRLDDSRIDAALAGGWETFRRSACSRILAEDTTIQINRCQRCHRVLRTPVAMQCFWCGCDWHRGDRVQGDVASH